LADDLAGEYLRATIGGAPEERVREKGFLRAFLSSIALAAGGFGLLTTAFISKSGVEMGGLFGPEVSRTDLQQINERLNRQVKSLNNDILAVKIAASQPGKAQTGDAAAIQNRAILSRLALIEKRQQKLEAVILDNPEKALTMPLMRRDIDNMRETNAQSLASIKASADQTWDLSKWLLGGLCVGVVSLAINNFTKRER
jgi:hypothetical protein